MSLFTAFSPGYIKLNWMSGGEKYNIWSEKHRMSLTVWKLQENTSEKLIALESIQIWAWEGESWKISLTDTETASSCVTYMQLVPKNRRQKKIYLKKSTIFSNLMKASHWISSISLKQNEKPHYSMSSTNCWKPTTFSKYSKSSQRKAHYGKAGITANFSSETM